MLDLIEYPRAPSAFGGRPEHPNLEAETDMHGGFDSTFADLLRGRAAAAIAR